METPAGTPSPSTYGIGARVSLYPMSDDYIDIITGALADAAPHAEGLEFSTGVVSTFVGGDESRLVAWLAALIGAATRRAQGAHLAVSILLSRGCPGEVTCELRSGPWVSDSPLGAHAVGVAGTAEWSLYPLPDADPAASGPIQHMEPILAAIEAARASGLHAGSDHYVTRLRGDVGSILALVAQAWRDTGALVQHVTSHVQISINSPSESRPS